MTTHNDPNRLLCTKNAARILGVSPAMMERLRWLGDGPSYFHPTGGRLVRYRLSDLLVWIDRHRVSPRGGRDDVR